MKMKKYSVEWKRKKGIWVQDHPDYSGEGKIWKIHYIEHDTEYSSGNFFSRAAAISDLRILQASNGKSVAV